MQPLYINNYRKLIILFLASIFSGVFYSSCSKDDNDKLIETSGIIEVTSVNISAKTSGEVISLRINEGDRIKVGDTIAIIDSEMLVLQLRLAEANFKSLQYQYKLIKKGARLEDIKSAEEFLAQAKINLENAERDKIRMEALFKGSSATQKQYEDALTRYELSLSQYKIAEENYHKIRSGSRFEEIKAAGARLESAQASIDILKKQIADCIILSPIDGIITNKLIEERELISTGSIIAKISNPEKAHLMIYVSETELPKIKIGDVANIKVDAYKDRVFQGRVVFINQNSEFIPKNIQTREDRTKLVFGVKLEIDNKTHELKAGIPADAILKIE